MLVDTVMERNGFNYIYQETCTIEPGSVKNGIASVLVTSKYFGDGGIVDGKRWVIINKTLLGNVIRFNMEVSLLSSGLKNLVPDAAERIATLACLCHTEHCAHKRQTPVVFSLYINADDTIEKMLHRINKTNDK